MKKQVLFKTKGMNRDLSVSAFNPEFAFENINLRLSTNEGNTMMSWVNEKGTELFSNILYPEYWSKDGEDDIYEDPQDESWTHHEAVVLTGTPIGTAVINHTLVLFTTTTTVSANNEVTLGADYIYKLFLDTTTHAISGKILFEDNINFLPNHPLETLVSYESEAIQKVYWTDGVNQPRLINIADEDTAYNSDSFNFIRKLKLEETVKIKKSYNTSGIFAPGVIQYAFTYYSKYAQETAIFYTSPLLYVSHRDRGASPEDKVSCAFKITVENVDTDFDYIRIYSIQRTSINGTPICKRIQDISTKNLNWVDDQNHNKGKKATYTDIGTSGNSVDPTELLYKGGETILVNTMESKDNTLFMGGITLNKLPIIEFREDIQDAASLHTHYRYFKPLEVLSGDYQYASQLTSETPSGDTTVPCGGFKGDDYYRCGIQFQHETGVWSDPIWIKDHQINEEVRHTTPSAAIYPTLDSNGVKVPIIHGSIISNTNNGVLDKLRQRGYKKARPVVVFPELIDRTVICQGVVNPTLYTSKQRDDGSLYAQSSWFFRPFADDSIMSITNEGAVYPRSQGFLNYTQKNVYEDASTLKGFPDEDMSPYNPYYIRRVEIEGDYDDNNKYQIDWKMLTMHSPDIEFDEQLSLYDFTNINYKKIGYVSFYKTLCDISIQTESPTISSLGKGFVSGQVISGNLACGIVSGLFYDDLLVDDDGTNFQEYSKMKSGQSSVKWLVYPWQANGSLNNDVTRPADKGVASAVLKKKVISNLRYTNTIINTHTQGDGSWENAYAQLFSSGENTIVQVNNHTTPSQRDIYRGNIDIALNPDHQDGKYFACNGISWGTDSAGGRFSFNDTETPFLSEKWVKTFNGVPGSDYYTAQGPTATIRMWEFNSGSFPYDFWLYASDVNGGNDIGNTYRDLVLKKSPVRIKYKSTPHIIMSTNIATPTEYDYNNLPILEILNSTDATTRFGGQNPDAFKENVWVPCGEPVSLSDTQTSVDSEDSSVTYEQIDFFYSYGDTYYQRWDCLKTYAYTSEDINQVVEIGSFMLETHVNIDGRYDRNRGQSNNLNVSPKNFNLINPVYSQKDNFFSYKIQDEDSYRNISFPNQVYYSKTKTSGADTDLWTNVTLASMLEMDGDKGSITKLIRFNDQLIAFQDSGVSQILYNENVQVASTTGVPIEIANSEKVQGKRYLSDTIGCKNKWSVVSGTNGIYFIDSNNKSIFLYNGELTCLSDALGFNAWCKQEVKNKVWEPRENFNDSFVSYYDRKNQEILFINKDKALAYNEKLGVFTSFYDYGNTPYFCNLEDIGVWVRPDASVTNTINLWEHQGGAYGKFFGVNKPYSMTLVGNPEPQTTKLFTNLEFRACVTGEGSTTDDVYTPFTPFKELETWNEYQHGIANMTYSRNSSTHHKLDNTASLKRLFRTWRCDIPRDNYDWYDSPIQREGETQEDYQQRVAFYNTWLQEEHSKGIFRTNKHPMDRMNNPWLYLKLTKDAASVRDSLNKAEIHDIVLTYFT